jgi:hypothetical protein
VVLGVRVDGDIADGTVFARVKGAAFSKFKLDRVPGKPRQFEAVLTAGFLGTAKAVDYYIVVTSDTTFEEVPWHSEAKPYTLQLTEDEPARVLHIHVTPEAAVIALDGATAGLGIFDGPCPAGKHRLVAELEGYETKIENFRMPPNRDLSLTFELLPKPTGAAPAGPGVTFQSTPAGAQITVDNVRVCTSTPCQATVKPGHHVVLAHLDGFELERREIDAADGTVVALPLTARASTLQVETIPPGIPISIDGAAATDTKGLPQPRPPGPVGIRVDAPCWKPLEKRVAVRTGEAKIIQLKLEPRTAALEVHALLGDKDTAGEVLVDNQSVGRAPGTFNVPLCSKTIHVQVLSAAAKAWTGTLHLAEEHPTRINAHF